MEPIKIGVIIGSIRKDSYNKRLAKALEKMAPSEFVFKEIRIDNLPLYNQDNDDNPGPEAVQFKNEVKSMDALLFITPEYNRSIPGVLKNALDHGSRPYGKSVWGGKPGAVIGVSPGQTGTALAQQHLRNILAYLDVYLLGQPEAFLQYNDALFNADGTIGPKSEKFLQNWLQSFFNWIKR